MKVRAVLRGYYGDSLREVGSEFDIASIDELSDADRVGKGTPGWMRVVSCTPEEQKTLDASRAAQKAQREAQRAASRAGAPVAAAAAKVEKK
jgi:hypothetical protein